LYLVASFYLDFGFESLKFLENPFKSRFWNGKPDTRLSWLSSHPVFAFEKPDLIREPVHRLPLEKTNPSTVDSRVQSLALAMLLIKRCMKPVNAESLTQYVKLE
jgi:hypothetical protein